VFDKSLVDDELKLGLITGWVGKLSGMLDQLTSQRLYDGCQLAA